MATHINGLCLPMVFLGANTPYTPITLEGLEADIAKLEALLAQANNCLITCEGRVINVSSLTMDAGDIVIHTEDTTAGGYVSAVFGATEIPVPPFANPISETMPPIDFLEALRGGELSEFGMNLYLDAAGITLCDTITIDIFAQTGIKIPTVGAATLFNTPAVFALPTCAGTLSYTELFEAGGDPIGASVNSATGVVTIPAQTLASGTGRYYYYVTCTVLGVPTVIATCYLEVINN
jgi:hypothetical protein